MCLHNLYTYTNRLFYHLIPKKLNYIYTLYISVIPEDGYKKYSKHVGVVSYIFGKGKIFVHFFCDKIILGLKIYILNNFGHICSLKWLINWIKRDNAFPMTYLTNKASFSVRTTVLMQTHAWNSRQRSSGRKMWDPPGVSQVLYEVAW